MDPTRAKRRRWLRFSLRTLLLIVTAGAMFSWVYFIGWPLWRERREQVDFVASTRQLKAGITERASGKIIRPGSSVAQAMALGSTAQGEPIIFGIYSWKSACYCIFYVLPSDGLRDIASAASTRVEVYRLPRVPAGYKSRRYSGEPMGAYIWDFQAMLAGQKNGDMDFQNELIYSDPPADPKPH